MDTDERGRMVFIRLDPCSSVVNPSFYFTSAPPVIRANTGLRFEIPMAPVVKEGLTRMKGMQSKHVFSSSSPKGSRILLPAQAHQPRPAHIAVLLNEALRAERRPSSPERCSIVTLAKLRQRGFTRPLRSSARNASWTWSPRCEATLDWSTQLRWPLHPEVSNRNLESPRPLWG